MLEFHVNIERILDKKQTRCKGYYGTKQVWIVLAVQIN